MKYAIAWVDLLFNVIIRIMLILFLAMLQINPQRPEEVSIKELQANSEIIITLEWDKSSQDDMDLWVVDPNKTKVGYANRDVNSIYLDRDNTGVNNYFLDESNNKVDIPERVENMFIRNLIAGEYIVVIHAFSKNSKNPTNVKVKIYDNINKKDIFVLEEKIEKQGQQLTVLRFAVNSSKQITGTSRLEYRLVR